MSPILVRYLEVARMFNNWTDDGEIVQLGSLNELGVLWSYMTRDERIEAIKNCGNDPDDLDRVDECRYEKNTSPNWNPYTGRPYNITTQDLLDAATMKDKK